MAEARTVGEVLEKVTAGLDSDREMAIALHDYIRDHVKFGFNKYFDASQPDYVLTCGIGHCNPKSRLMVSLLRAIGLESYVHYFAIHSDILSGVLPPGMGWVLPSQLTHGFTEVKIDGSWHALDSYVIDTSLLNGAQARLAEEGRSLGYGVRIDSTNVWDGECDAFSQFDPSLMVEDHGRVEDHEAYSREARYRNRKFGLGFNTVFKYMGGILLPRINAHIDSIRQ